MIILKLKHTCCWVHLLIGCDGKDSIIRGYLTNDRVRLVSVGQCLMQGVIDLENLAESTDMKILTPDEFLNFCPSGTMNTFVDGESKFSVTNLGNNLLGWRLLVPQNEDGELAVVLLIECILHAKKKRVIRNRKNFNDACKCLCTPTNQ